jgi:hypothetical protein
VGAVALQVDGHLSSRVAAEGDLDVRGQARSELEGLGAEGDGADGLCRQQQEENRAVMWVSIASHKKSEKEKTMPGPIRRASLFLRACFFCKR